MTALIRRVSCAEIGRIINEEIGLASSEAALFAKGASSTSAVWQGYVDGALVCVWGLMPPTLLSDRAYLWLWTCEKLKGHEFTFIRHSQIAVEEMLKLYPFVYGHTDVTQKRSIRWLQWLGAEFGPPCGGYAQFWIRAKDAGSEK